MKKNSILAITTFFLLVLSTGCMKEIELNAQPNITSAVDAGLKPLSLWEPDSQENVIYIDPTYTSNIQKGTIENPFTSFRQVTWQDKLVIVLKRGSRFKSEPIVIMANDIILASYGTGARPVITINSQKAHALSLNWTGSSNVTIRDIEVIANDCVSALIVRDNSQHIEIINCKFSGSTWGIRVLNNIQDITIDNTEIFNILDDGVFIKNTNQIEIKNCYIHHVNQNWRPPSTPEEQAGGDGIQLELCDNWHVHHNMIDRSDNGNKFCFIANNDNQKNGILEYNFLKGPNRSFAVYIGSGSNLIVRYNHIAAPASSPVYTHSKAIEIYYNIFDQVTGPLFADDAVVYNNLFYLMGTPTIQGKNITAKNNIFDLNTSKTDRFKVSGTLVEDHNLIVRGLPTPGLANGVPGYIDPTKSNFRITNTSHCIDKGANVGISKDLDEKPVPNGSAPDIGPYEF